MTSCLCFHQVNLYVLVICLCWQGHKRECDSKLAELQQQQTELHSQLSQSRTLLTEVLTLHIAAFSSLATADRVSFRSTLDRVRRLHRFHCAPCLSFDSLLLAGCGNACR